MSGTPLHPMFVHFPLVLAALVPIFSLAALWAIRRGRRASRAWLVPVALVATLGVTGAIAVKTGGTDEDIVEHIVPSAPIQHHEQHAIQFILLAAVVGGFALLGLVRGIVGESARIVASIGSFVLLGYAVQVGQAGGELAYRAGAASAYSQQVVTPNNAPEEPDR